MHPLRNHKSYIAAIGHRLSGLALVLFLPFHFLLLGTAIEGAEGLEQALEFTRNPMVKIAEWGLVTLLVLHFSFGIRVLLLEFTPFPQHRLRLPRYVVPGFVLSAILGVLFFIQILRE